MADDKRRKRDREAEATGATKREGRGRHVTASYRAGEAPSGDAEDGAAEAREILAPGTKVGRYEVLRLVGEGGMGTVYEALDARLNRKVALKILSSTLKSKRKAAKRFSIEAQAAARLVHPNVVGIFDFDVDCEIPYMAMEFLQGETLAEAIARGPLAFDRLADIMLAVCAGVHAAHQAGIVHRDLKPSNIILCADWKGNPSARVLDFGISKVGGISISGLTETGDIVGTSQYLSPEQAAGLRFVNQGSDQYSLGVVLYECVTGRTPQRGERIHNLLRNVSEGRHAPPRHLRKDLPPELEAIIERAMAVKVKDRFPSVYELGRALFSFASAEGRRQFDDFYNRVEGSSDAGEAKVAVAASAPATHHLARAPVPSWQSRTTRTSQRPGGRQRGAGEVMRTHPARSGRSRRVLWSILLGALIVAVAAVAVVGLVIGAR
jgi:serine/threonine-protein kinase